MAKSKFKNFRISLISKGQRETEKCNLLFLLGAVQISPSCREGKHHVGAGNKNSSRTGGGLKTPSAGLANNVVDQFCLQTSVLSYSYDSF